MSGDAERAVEVLSELINDVWAQFANEGLPSREPEEAAALGRARDALDVLRREFVRPAGRRTA